MITQFYVDGGRAQPQYVRIECPHEHCSFPVYVVLDERITLDTFVDVRANPFRSVM